MNIDSTHLHELHQADRERLLNLLRDAIDAINVGSPHAAKEILVAEVLRLTGQGEGTPQ